LLLHPQEKNHPAPQQRSNLPESTSKENGLAHT
jgi:hypothetical protein